MVASHGDGRLAAMGIFAWLLSGLIAGAIARVFAPSPRGLGCIGTIALGLVGSVVGGTLANLAFDGNFELQGSGLIGSVNGAIVVLTLARRFSRSDR